MSEALNHYTVIYAKRVLQRDEYQMLTIENNNIKELTICSFQLVLGVTKKLSNCCVPYDITLLVLVIFIVFGLIFRAK